MARALILAHRGVAQAHPNPLVGAVIVKNDRIVGEGFHAYDGRHHAEVIALDRAQGDARGATLYVNLEPCCHTGRTGPCTQAILQSRLKRVVIAMNDPNPAVAGRGIRELQKAGIEVRVGVHEAEARRLNEAFAKWIRSKLPFVMLKTALTLDGRIAARTGSATWLTSPESREEVQRIRHASDALLTGIGTVLIDDPRMSDRSGLPRRRPLLRVILDSKLRMPISSQIVKAAKGDVLIFTASSATSSKARALQKAGIEVVQIPSRAGGLDLRRVLRELGHREILSLLVEAGAQLNGAVLSSGIVDKMILFYAPKVLGGGVPMAAFPSRPLAKFSPLTNLSFRQFGPDFMVEGYFHDVYRHH